MFKAICFDFDGTLSIGINSVEYLCILNNAEKELAVIERLKNNNELDWVEADFMKAKLLKGLYIDAVERNFDDKIELIEGINEVVRYIKNRGYKSLVITSGPNLVAASFAKRYGIDYAYGSIYEIKEGRFTGSLLKHLDSKGKLKCLVDFCLCNNIELNECIAVGDGFSDVDIFKAVGKSIAINYCEEVYGLAGHYILTGNIQDIIGFI